MFILFVKSVVHSVHLKTQLCSEKLPENRTLNVDGDGYETLQVSLFYVFV